MRFLRLFFERVVFNEISNQRRKSSLAKHKLEVGVVLLGAHNKALVRVHPVRMRHRPVKPLHFFVLNVKNAIFVNESLVVGSHDVEKHISLVTWVSVDALKGGR